MVGIKPPVRVCVIGDEGVGKTSLITAAATESFPDSPPPTLPTTKLPPDSTPEGVPVQIFDTCSRPEERPALEVSGSLRPASLASTLAHCSSCADATQLLTRTSSLKSRLLSCQALVRSSLPPALSPSGPSHVCNAARRCRASTRT